MEGTYTLTLQKSSKKHESEGKKWLIMRKPGKFKEVPIHFRLSNKSKNKFNFYLLDKKIVINEVDKLTKAHSTLDSSQVTISQFYHCICMQLNCLLRTKIFKSTS